MECNGKQPLSPLLLDSFWKEISAVDWKAGEFEKPTFYSSLLSSAL
jgi:hypothetical protein